MLDSEPRLPAPFRQGPNATAAERSAWEASISRYVANLVAYKLSQETSASKLFAAFYTPEHDALLFYYACAHLLSATARISEAGKHLGLIAELFRRLKQEGLRRDGPNGLCTFGNAIVLPALRALVGDIPAPPGHRYDRARLILVPDPGYIQRSSFPNDLVKYRRKQEGLIRLWGLVARLESDHIVGEPGSMSLVFHQTPLLLRALEDPVQRGVWETLWASVLQCEEDMEGWGAGVGAQWLGPFKDALRTLVRDSRTPIEWRGRFCMILEALERNR
ncbi:hypothetical protein C8F04DRAFT_1257648 [Mycena alexandri]|uniref:Uncharacterized protein n=1 Tax=Mycena alexandri TaxID=1745969 RepID=A0AAD6X5Z3_9AGAR|nr:hypothetical protein C8F04DRAFT_1257648 [Mycena alexandri]